MKGAVAGLSGSLALVLLLPMEAGVPIPVPADLVMFTVGERVAAGKFPLWLAVAGFEVIAVLGTTALFVACRGPAQRIIARFGPRLGLTEARLRRAAAFAETRGRPGLALGRGTPGLRTVTVVAAAVSGLNGRRALPALIVGSSVFLQLHLVLGLLLGPLAGPGWPRRTRSARNPVTNRRCWCASRRLRPGPQPGSRPPVLRAGTCRRCARRRRRTSASR
jgi:membrane protein DedA with SNARE-associated domain